MPRKPNVLFLFSDQHNARCLSCAGHPEVQTPNLDALAARGVRFENAYAQNPICTPSRMSVLSSLYPSTHGYYGLYGREPSLAFTSMFRYFSECGYRTGALGKLHTPRYWIERDCQFVYDEFIEHPRYLEGAGLYEQNDNRGFVPKRDGNASLLPLEYSCEAALVQQFVRFLNNEGEPKDRGDDAAPWMAWVSFSRPHGPLAPSEPFASMYPPDSLTLPPTAETEAEHLRQRRTRPDFELRSLRAKVSAYLGLVSQVDDAIGHIIAALESRDQLDNTIIAYAADHGDYAGEHGLYEKVGGISTRAITRIPLIIRYPHDVPAGRVCHEMVESVDIFPTLCELAQLPIPNHVQGTSITPLLRDEPVSIRDTALTENAYRKALATRRYRYVANIGEQPDELYDLDDDPWELVNHIDDPAYAEIVRSMQRKLLDRLVRARRPVTTGNGGWHKHRYDRDGRIDLKENREVIHW